MTSPKTWQETMREKFSPSNGFYEGFGNEMVSFINDLLSDQATRLREAMEKVKKVGTDECQCGGSSCAATNAFNHGREAVLSAFDKALNEEV